MISGPSGVGKGTLRKALFDAVKGLEYSISCSTREPREGETEGVDYSFIGHERFRELVEQGSFLEWAEVHGNLYGTLKESVERILSEGRDAVLEIDVQGALQVKDSMPEAVLVFILPPSEEELRNRLDRRGTEKEEDLKGRLKEARNEILLSARYDHLVVNDDLDRALEALRKIIESYRAPGQTP
ncbi:MAG TPA: guanylate kinase [Synergistales bacterium]|nr:guanylate kinase [Synergistales bacterium]